jgi:hypothetical protein
MEKYRVWITISPEFANSLHHQNASDDDVKRLASPTDSYWGTLLEYVLGVIVDAGRQ